VFAPSFELFFFFLTGTPLQTEGGTPLLFFSPPLFSEDVAHSPVNSDAQGSPPSPPCRYLRIFPFMTLTFSSRPRERSLPFPSRFESVSFYVLVSPFSFPPSKRAFFLQIPSSCSERELLLCRRVRSLFQPTGLPIRTPPLSGREGGLSPSLPIRVAYVLFPPP